MQEIRQIWNVRRLLDWSVNYFKSKEIPQPKLSAELLLASVLNSTRMQLYLNFDRILNESELAKYRTYVLKRSENMPVQYILNEAHFRNLTLYVNENVLIPRPETELVVDKVLQCLTEMSEYSERSSGVTGSDITLCGSLNILEVGTGSGAIAISIAGEIDRYAEKSLKKSLDWSIIATEKSEAALVIAKKNAEKSLDFKKLQKLKFFYADIIPENDKKFLSEYGEKINIVVSNPPYICFRDYEVLPDEVRQYEPSEALLAGETGLEVYKEIIEHVRPLICHGLCAFVFETDPAIIRQVKELISESLAAEEITVEKDYNGRERVITAKTYKI